MLHTKYLRVRALSYLIEDVKDFTCLHKGPQYLFLLEALHSHFKSQTLILSLHNIPHLYVQKDMTTRPMLLE